MRFVQLGLIVCLTALTPIQGSRLNRLEEDVDALKRFMFRELLSIRDQVKDISIRVDTLENATVMQDPSSTNQYMDIHSNNIGDETGTEHNEARLVKAEVQNMRKAYANDKKDLHQLTNDVKGQLRELEQKITSHMHNLTAEVQHNIEYIHKNLSLANVTLSEFINVSNSNVSIFSDNIKMEIKKVFASSSEDLELRLNETEEKIKSNISLTYSHIEDELERFMSLADRNVSEMMLKAHSIFSMIRTNFTEMTIQSTNLSLELQTTKNEMKGVEKRLGDKLQLISSHLEKEIVSLIFLHYYYYIPGAKDIRLANASAYHSTGIQGRLEVRHDKKWGTVCDDSFERYVTEAHITNNVNVVCRMFGFRECEYVIRAGLGKGSGAIWMDKVKCEGGESCFLECPHLGWGKHGCNHEEDIGFRMRN
ncbi:uncharacterized protein LOC128222559 [Mya arenaria]|uniref:uncharacterized protein LOC128222559 n=1 Tax=Mya arenaria TaxID=6604 RepID=UPI0022E59391|nr:uncharacterized protein LOC128222559 [Mya arenaria]XP_052787590.1 uncharacterized protein LOC128222559 [Mya arenaria]